MSDCIFCAIVKRDIPCDIVYESERIIAFNDLNPQAPLHQLIIPKKHIATLNDLDNNDEGLLGEMILCAANLAKSAGFDQSGYRTIFNCRQDGGQEVYHIHLHLLAGRQLKWPPG